MKPFPCAFPRLLLSMIFTSFLCPIFDFCLLFDKMFIGYLRLPLSMVFSYLCGSSHFVYVFVKSEELCIYIFMCVSIYVYFSLLIVSDMFILICFCAWTASLLLSGWLLSLCAHQNTTNHCTLENVKMTGETLEVRFDKRKQREERGEREK